MSSTSSEAGATALPEEQIEAAAEAIYEEWRSPDYFTWEQAVEGRNANPDPTFPHIVDKFRVQAKAALIAASRVQEPNEDRKLMQSLAKWVNVSVETPSLEIACEVSSALEDYRAALSVSASADPADEHHDAEEREAESEDHAATVTGDREKLIAEAQAAFDAAGHMPQGTMDHESQWLPFARLYNVTERMIDALAAPVEVDEAKLGTVLSRAYGERVMDSPADYPLQYK